MWKSLTISQIKRLYRRNGKLREKRFLPFADAQNIVVLADAQGAQQVLPILQSWVNAGKRVTLYYFTFALKQTELLFPGIDTVEISLQELCWGNNRPRTEVCKDFLALQPDAVIDLTLEVQLPVSYFMAISTAPLHIGMKKEGLTPADVMMQQVETSFTPESLLQNILHYWMVIK